MNLCIIVALKEHLIVVFLQSWMVRHRDYNKFQDQNSWFHGT